MSQTASVDPPLAQLAFERLAAGRNAALLNGELTETELKEMAVFLTHYLGFLLGSALNGAVDAVVAKCEKAAAQGAGEDQKAKRGCRVEDAHG